MALGVAASGLCWSQPSQSQPQEQPSHLLISATPNNSAHLRRPIQIFSGTAHPELAGKIAASLGLKLAPVDVKTFNCGETSVQINESVRDRDVFVINPTCNPRPNDYLMELLVMCDAIRRAGAMRITAVVPLFGYARQDKKDAGRTPITAKLVADMLQLAGADRVITVDLHAAQIQGFVTYPMDNLYASPLIKEYIDEELIGGKPEDVVIVSPDVGGAKRAEAMASSLKTGLAIFSKKRAAAGLIDKMVLVGEVEGKKCVMLDDMCDTGGTLCKAAQMLKEAGATEVHAAVTHGILSNPALTRISASEIDRFIVTDSIPMNENCKSCSKIVVISLADLLASAIQRIHNGESVSYLFDSKPVDVIHDPNR